VPQATFGLRVMWVLLVRAHQDAREIHN